MKVYVIVEKDSYGCEFLINECFASKEKAIKFCNENNNNDTYDYLQSCEDNYEMPGNYVVWEIRELEVEE